MIETINWSIFRQEQIQILKPLIESKQWEKLALSIEVDNPEQEKELNMITASLRPKVLVNESLVKEELKKKELEGFRIETPEQEIEWQKKFDEEKKTQQEEFEKQYPVENQEDIKKKVGRPKKIDENSNQ